MRAVVQRVSSASVTVDGEVTGAIEQGLLILLGVGPEDTDAEIAWLSSKIAHLRIFADEDGKMNRSVVDVSGGVLVVSQFTLYGDCRGAPSELREPPRPGSRSRCMSASVRRWLTSASRWAEGSLVPTWTWRWSTTVR